MYLTLLYIMVNVRYSKTCILFYVFTDAPVKSASEDAWRPEFNFRCNACDHLEAQQNQIFIHIRDVHKPSAKFNDVINTSVHRPTDLFLFKVCCKLCKWSTFGSCEEAADKARQHALNLHRGTNAHDWRCRACQQLKFGTIKELEEHISRRKHNLCQFQEDAAKAKSAKLRSAFQNKKAQFVQSTSARLLSPVQSNEPAEEQSPPVIATNSMFQDVPRPRKSIVKTNILNLVKNYISKPIAAQKSREDQSISTGSAIAVNCPESEPVSPPRGGDLRVASCANTGLVVDQLFNCLYCKTKFRITDSLAHMRQFHMSDAFQCRACADSPFDFGRQLVDHVMSCHAPISCAVKDARGLLSSPEVARLGLAAPEDCRESSCSVCGLVFLAQDEFKVKAHAKKEHGDVVSPKACAGAVRHRCRVCLAEFKSGQALNAHCWGSDGTPLCIASDLISFKIKPNATSFVIKK